MKATLDSSPLSLRGHRVIDAMHPGVISCPAETSLQIVARMMATYRVHAIVVVGDEAEELRDGNLWGVLTDIELVRAAQSPDFDEQTAGALAATPAVTVTTVDDLARAVQLMIENEVTHLLVVERRSKKPVGVLSTLDVARRLAGVSL